MMQSTTRRAISAGVRPFVWLACLAMVCLGVSANAQTEASGAQEDRRRVIEEVVVMARRIEESMQDAPVSVNAFTQRDIDQLGILEVGDFARYTPGLEMRHTLAALDNVAVNLRGIGDGEVSLAIEPPVGTYLDGVYLARITGMAFDLVDLERVEVLRGPQGTLFGRNSVGGAINLISRKPQGELGFRHESTIGQRGRREFRTSVDTPMFGDFAASMTYLRKERGGLVRSAFTGDKQGEIDSNAFRLAVSWTPTETFRADYSYDLSRRNSLGNNHQVTHVRPAFTDPDSDIFGGAWYQTLAANSSPKRQGRVAVGSAGQEHTSNIDGHGLTLTWDVAPNLTLKSITGYREWDSTNQSQFAVAPAPADGSLCPIANYDLVAGSCSAPVPAGELVRGFTGRDSFRAQDQWQQEFQLIGRAMADRLRYTVGAFFFTEEGSELADPASGNTPTLVLPAASLVPAAIQPQNRGNSLVITQGGFLYTTENTSYAVYGDFTYSVTPRLDASLGLRWTRDEKKANLTISGDPRNTPLVPGSDSWSKFNPAFTMTYNATEGVMLYGKAQSAYRSGGFNIRQTDVNLFQTPFDEENAIGYELGWKADLFDRRVRFNGAIYRIEYDDQQVGAVVSTPDGVINDIVNAGESTHQGFEIEATWIPTPGLRLSAVYAYLDASFDELITVRQDPITGFPPNPGVNEDVSDTAKPGQAPKNSLTLFAEYEFERRPWGVLTLNGNGAFTDETFFNPQLNVFAVSPSHWTFSARATVSEIPAGGGYLKASLWARNLTNEEVVDTVADFGSLGQATAAFREMRSFGVTVGYQFNR